MEDNKEKAALKHLESLKRLIEVEKEEDIGQMQQLLSSLDASSCQARGLSILNLRMGSCRVGLGGKMLVDFELDVGSFGPRASFDALQSFRQGDIVEVCCGGGGEDKRPSGVVFKCSNSHLTVAFKDDSCLDCFNSDLYRINKLANDVHYARMSKGLDTLIADMPRGLLSPLSSVVLGLGKPELDVSIYNTPFNAFNTSLNQPQLDAVSFALASRTVSLILGPPGTGKTTVVVELIRQALALNKRVLVCAPSNIAVDNILERMPVSTRKSVRILRVGHPARILPNLMDFSMDIQLRNSNGGQVIADLKREIDSVLAKIPKTKSYADRRALYTTLKDLKRDLRKREPKVLKELVSTSNVIFTTLSSSGGRILDTQEFDLLIMDEVSQSMEPECWIALLKSKKAVLVGDPNQLPPTIMSSKAQGLSTTLFTRLVDLHGAQSVKRELKVQYRMHPDIMAWCNQTVYEGLLEGVPDSEWLLSKLPAITSTDDTILPLIIVDTAGFEYFELMEGDNTAGIGNFSIWNDEEAQICVEHVQTLIDAGVSQSQIAVISPYAAQVRAVREMLTSKNHTLVEVGTVDGFQGREKEVICVSLVRSNDRKEVGFLADMRRLNVALTRARRQLFIVCDSDTISTDKFMEKMVDFMMEHADIRYPTK